MKNSLQHLIEWQREEIKKKTEYIQEVSDRAEQNIREYVDFSNWAEKQEKLKARRRKINSVLNDED